MTLRPLFCLFLSGCLRQVSLYKEHSNNCISKKKAGQASPTPRLVTNLKTPYPFLVDHQVHLLSCPEIISLVSDELYEPPINRKKIHQRRRQILNLKLKTDNQVHFHKTQ